LETNKFSDVIQVIADQLKFKAKLAIGENAYTTLKLKNKLADFWEVSGAVGTGAAIAKSTVVASTFFSPGGLVGLVGLGVAVTPVGWVLAAAVLSGGAVLGVRRWLGDATGDRVTVIPKFINTPIDVLAVNLFDLLAPLAFKVAATDGRVTEDERDCISNYFISEWGYDPLFVAAGSTVIESTLDDFSIKNLAETFAEFSKVNPDCNYAEMTRDVIEFIKAVGEADGIFDEREEFALAKIESIFLESGRTFTKENFEKVTSSIVESVRRGKESLLKSEVLDRTKDGFSTTKDAAMKSVNETFDTGKTLFSKLFK
jgi:tellurite resistance protein